MPAGSGASRNKGINCGVSMGTTYLDRDDEQCIFLISTFGVE